MEKQGVGIVRGLPLLPKFWRTAPPSHSTPLRSVLTATLLLALPHTPQHHEQRRHDACWNRSRHWVRHRIPSIYALSDVPSHTPIEAPAIVAPCLFIPLFVVVAAHPLLTLQPRCSGTGYIGSFTTLALLEHGYDVVIVDSLYNSSKVALDRIELLCGRRPEFYQVDVTDEKALDEVFQKHPAIDSVIHFAALKAVGESGDIPLEYYRVNVGGSIALLRAMEKNNVSNIVFSSSATVYGDATRFPNMIPIPENCPIQATNTYGRTKSMIEDVITDFIKAQRNNLEKAGKPFQQWNGALLRYFNPCGAHPSGIMGEDPQGVPFNLLPLLGKVATGARPKLTVFGEDYASRDGTAIRDYIHVLDLAQGHLLALNYLRENNPGVKAWNLGSGRGSTVFEIIKAFSAVVGRDLPYEVAPRRAGDVLDLTANPSLANKELKWKTELTMEKACEDLWRWVDNNPQGYRQEPPAALLDAIKKKA
ncbi:hypothetical protein G7046_g8457 [Stylonectria norvegica]|nr:hypothetical protein G7046_g8457 [Stylonectria norvegica]